MPQARFACIAVMIEYRPDRRDKTTAKGTPMTSLFDFERASKILETLFASDKFSLSLELVMLLGY